MGPPWLVWMIWPWTHGTASTFVLAMAFVLMPSSVGMQPSLHAEDGAQRKFEPWPDLL